MTVIMGPMAAAPTTTLSTRERLIAAAIEVFAAQGYDGARVQDIARAAGLTTGAIYANYRGKADLLFDAIVALAGEEVEALLVHARGRDARELIEQLGADLTRRATATRPSLLLDAIVAARRDPELAAMLRRRIAAREAMFAELFARALHDGAITTDVDPATLARYCMHVAMGALVLRTLDLVPPDQPAWDALIHRLVGALAPTQEDNP
jgi:AcrR family transcriptional regulator